MSQDNRAADRELQGNDSRTQGCFRGVHGETAIGDTDGEVKDLILGQRHVVPVQVEERPE